MHCQLLKVLSFVLVLTGSAGVAVAQLPEDQVVETAIGVLEEVMRIPARQIPTSLLANAQGVAIIPNVVKGGFVVGVRHGRGVMLVRDEQGAWQPPFFVTITGGSVGWQAGIQSTDLVLVFGTRRSITGLMNGKLTLGVDAAAAAGPVGRNTAASTDATLSAEILSYSKSRGLFAGVSIDGSSLQIDQQAAAAYYRPRAGAPLAADGTSLALPASAVRLLNAIHQHTSPAQIAPAENPPAQSPAAPLPATLPVTAANSGAAALGGQLADAQRKLLPLLDPTWQGYLQIPLAEGGQPIADSARLAEVLKRYDAVATDARYAALAQRPEFTAAYELLRRYATAVSTVGSTGLTLPAPPGTAGPNGARY
ncbi:MAG: lipid-binding SYLF domain-containing protein [Pirellulaceae bacterium]|nr:lipid-binding SYLF domain-containing protein [Pirellulaceae bacterium]